MKGKRACGLLMPIFSLPGKYGIGCFSNEAYKFVDFLEETGQSYWQILPLGPTGYGDSPYQSFSTFAGNPYFISLESLIRQNLLTEKECEAAKLGTDPESIDYEKMYYNRYPLLKKAYQRFVEKRDRELMEEYEDFRKENQDWIRDYSCYMALKDAHGGKSLFHWKPSLRKGSDGVREEVERTMKEVVGFYTYLQFEFDRQWKRLKTYANRKGIRIVGDLPIYVSSDSADYWAHPELFQTLEDGSQKAQAGCPPDGFSPDGQLWGNPLYDWPYHRKSGYAWWILRMKKCLTLYDIVRIDHFRGFDEYYSIPRGRTNARIGQWEKGPGIEIFDALKDALGRLPIMVEDLGFMTDSVRRLVKKTGYPNMKVLGFAFDLGDAEGINDYLPHNYPTNCVVYTGTHDNETMVGWLGTISPALRRHVRNYLGISATEKGKIADAMIRSAYASVADTCIIPIQDYLHLDNRARINFPSTLGENWMWRLKSMSELNRIRENVMRLSRTYRRWRK